MRRRLLTVVTGLTALVLGIAVVTLAAPGAEECFAQAGAEPDVEGRIACPAGAGTPGATTPGGGGGNATACVANTRLRSVAATRRGRGLRFGFVRRGAGPVTVDVFRVSVGRRIVGNRRVVRFASRTGAFSWSGRGRRVGDGIYFARFRARGAETTRVALRRRGGRFTGRPRFETRTGCGAIRAFKLERPVFGGRTNRALKLSYRLNRAARVTVTVTRGSRTIRSFRTTSDRAGRTYRLRLPAERLRRGDYRVNLSVRPSSGRTATAGLISARL